MKNIFENAYFGKPYRTRSGDKALFFWKDDVETCKILQKPLTVVCIIDKLHCLSSHTLDGIIYRPLDKEGSRSKNHDYDIISEWQEEIDEEELNSLAILNTPDWCYCDKSDVVTYQDAFKDGYRKAKQE